MRKFFFWISLFGDINIEMLGNEIVLFVIFFIFDCMDRIVWVIKVD